VLAFGLGRYENYVGPELANLLACTHRTLGEIFPHVMMIPGGRVYYLASENPLDPDIASRLEERGLTGRLVNRHYLAAVLAPDRLADLARVVTASGETNTDFNPVLYSHLLRHWLSQFAFPARAVGVVAFLACLVHLFRLTVLSRVVFTAGFSAAVLEIVMLLGFQIFYGSLYRQLGLVVTVFMAGLAGGAMMATRRGHAWPQHRAVAGLAGAIAGLGALLPLVLPRLAYLDALVHTAVAGQTVLLLMAFVLALMVGAQFSVAGRTAGREAPGSAARLFTADLSGAALGALLVSAVLIPLAGVTAVCLLTAGLNVVVAAPTLRLSARL
jgi:spermidine synthase